MRNIAIFDLDHTLIPLDSDNEWGTFLCRIGVVDKIEYSRRNQMFYSQYQAGTLDPVEYLEFALGTLAQFPRAQLDTYHAQFMDEIIRPVLLAPALDLVKRHRDQGDLVLIITATNRFVTEPIAREFAVDHLIASEPEALPDGRLTGKLLGVPTYGIGKVVHLHEWLAKQQLALNDFAQSFFYSDSQNDIPLLSIVSNPVATNPNALLSTHAEKQGWPTLHLFKQ